MKRIISFVVLILVFSAQPILADGPYYTKPNWPVCKTQTDLKRIIEYQGQKDWEAIETLIGQKRCFLVKENMPVYIVKNGELFIRVRPKGFTMELYMPKGGLK